MKQIEALRKQKLPPSTPWVGIRNISDYSPFGVLLAERTVEGAFYRNGFQGQEHDDEVKGEGNSVNYSYRMHDPRLGRFFAVDPLSTEYPWNSPYAFSENNVIHAFELEGLEKELANDGKASNKGTGKLIIISEDDVQKGIIELCLLTNFDYMLVPSIDGALFYTEQYMKEHELKELSFLAYNAHGTEGLKVLFSNPEFVEHPQKEDFFSESQSSKSLKSTDFDSKDPATQYAADQFLGLTSKVAKGKNFVLLACYINPDFGSEVIKNNPVDINFYTNYDVTTIRNYILDGAVFASSVVGTALTAEHCFEDGWTISTKSRQVHIDMSIKITPEANVMPCEANGTSTLCGDNE